MFFGIISFRNFRKGNCKPDNQPGSDGWRGNARNKSSETVKWICLAESEKKRITEHVCSGSGPYWKTRQMHRNINNEIIKWRTTLALQLVGLKFVSKLETVHQHAISVFAENARDWIKRQFLEDSPIEFRKNTERFFVCLDDLSTICHHVEWLFLTVISTENPIIICADCWTPSDNERERDGKWNPHKNQLAKSLRWTKRIRNDKLKGQWK